MRYVSGLVILTLFLAISYPSIILLSKAQEHGTLVMEWEQHWPTYGVGGTCIPGTHNLCLKEIDGDPYIEIMTGGSSYFLEEDGSISLREAPLKIWSWNGENLTIEAEHSWPGSISFVYAADIDGDGKSELLTSGSVRNDSGTHSSLRVWELDGASLSLKASFDGVASSAVSVADVNGDEVPEMITVGRFNNTSLYGARLYVWRMDENGLVLLDSVEWCVSNVTSVTSVFSEDLNNDGVVEIVTGGYAYDLKNSSGQMRVWQYKDNGFALLSNEEWRLVEGGYGKTIAGGVQGNTVVNNVKVGDVDSDGTLEIVTGGFAYDGSNVSAQLRVWSWDGEDLLLEKSMEWATDYLTEIKCVSLSDVDGDEKMEIVTSGGVGEESSFANSAAEPNQAQLKVWSWDGATFEEEYGVEWSIGDGVFAWNVGSGDVDHDGVVEIVTVGCMGEDTLCDPDMRIWSVRGVDGDVVFLGFVLAGAIAAVAVSAVVLFVVRKRGKHIPP